MKIHLLFSLSIPVSALIPPLLPRSRRSLLIKTSAFLTPLLLSSKALASPSPPYYNSLFYKSSDPAKPNPLASSKLLEQFRIKDQAFADNYTYKNSEQLASGSYPSSSPAQRLVPILVIQKDIRTFNALSLSSTPPDHSPPLSTILTMKAFLTTPSFDKLAFKKTFNAFADNIYYSYSSDRANVYLGGGATPTSSQSLAYLFRNEILGMIDEAKDEVDYAERALGGGEGYDMKGVEDIAGRMSEAMGKYLANTVDGAVLAEAERLLLAGGIEAGAG